MDGTKYITETTDRDDHLIMVHGLDFWSVLWELDQFARSEIKYSQSRTEEERLVFEEVRDFIREKMDEKNIDLDMVR